jgi:hypothetical protein
VEEQKFQYGKAVGNATSLSAGSAVEVSMSSPVRYARLNVSVAGAVAVATVWAKGIAREF